jgi:hypothetical protein
MLIVKGLYFLYIRVGNGVELGLIITLGGEQLSMILVQAIVQATDRLTQLLWLL